MKNLLLKLFITFTILVSNYTQAQYTDVINSNKPGFSESPYSVGTGVYQFETNFFYKKTSIEPTFSIPESFGADLLFRTSFFLEKLELNAQFTYQKDEVTFNNIFTSQYSTSGLSKFTIGAKYLLFQPEYTDKTKEVRSWRRRHAFDKKRFIPSVAVYLGINTDVVNDLYKTESVSPKLGVLLQQNLTNQFNVIYNLYYDKIGTDFSEISYIVTATQNFSDNWSGFIEHQGIFLKHQNNLNIGAGFAYLFNKDFQMNTSARFIKEGKSQGIYAGLGISYRIDSHYDSYTDLNDNGQQIKDTPISRYNKKQNNFFSRIFSVFKKKDKKKPIRKRSRKRISTKEKKGGFLGLFGKKKKKEESEIEKLEREIKELEKEVEDD
ncbi:transporter [Polaribacter sp. Z014]|uniref:transporter n=1 Tax=unclassified Polaribacter TaxID=196858 RepID=UPI00193B693D|nr:MULTISPECIES: transporter [unclassified Polaribacter]MCL7763220.1 transporter [Polaribacter sp. Z014]QVY67159.1 transporter [Polaribacter sp. Q13]